jgi:hypothetical protein
VAAITIQNLAIAGLTPSYGAAAAGDTVAVAGDERILVHVKNGGGSSITVTIPAEATPQTIAGFGSVAMADLTATIAAGAEKIIGPISSGYIDAATGTAAVNYSSTTSVTRTAYRCGKPV